ncbi:MAG: Fur family transcriptional regulator [Elusimicrobiota bacterium]
MEKTKAARVRIAQSLKSAGLRPTAQRLAIADYVLGKADHPTAEDVKHWADRALPKISLATIYNTLSALTRTGLIQEFKFPHTDRVIYDDNTADHFHFLDEATGRLYDLNPTAVTLKTRLSRKFDVRGVHVLLKGRLLAQLSEAKK